MIVTLQHYILYLAGRGSTWFVSLSLGFIWILESLTSLDLKQGNNFSAVRPLPSPSQHLILLLEKIQRKGIAE